MTRSEQVAKIINDNFGLKILPETYRRNKRDEIEMQDGADSWDMKVDPSQFPKRVPQILMPSDRGLTWEERREHFGLYDMTVTGERSSIFEIGSCHTLKEIIEADDKMIGIKVSFDTQEFLHFKIEIYDRPLTRFGNPEDYKYHFW